MTKYYVNIVSGALYKDEFGIAPDYPAYWKEISKKENEKLLKDY